MFYLFFFAVPFCRKVITISGNSDLRRYAAENQIDNAMSDVRYPLIKPYLFYFDQTIQSRVVNGTESLEVLLSFCVENIKKREWGAGIIILTRGKTT